MYNKKYLLIRIPLTFVIYLLRIVVYVSLYYLINLLKSVVTQQEKVISKVGLQLLLENSKKEIESIIVLNFLVKPKKNYFFAYFLGINSIVFLKK